jgi:TetR/AcrR family transcriptional regulator, transcriptional repressor for nem operon
MSEDQLPRPHRYDETAETKKGGTLARTKPAEQRRADLLAAAQELFITKGLAATTLEDITNGAGVSQGLFYHYFRSKDDIIFALQEQFSARFAQRVLDAAASKTDWAAKLDACVEASFAGYHEMHDLHEILFRHDGKTRDEPAHALFAGAVRDLLEAGIAAGAYTIADPAATAVLLYAAMHAFDPAFHGVRPPTDRQLTTAAQALFRRTAGISEPPPNPSRREP